MSSLEHLQRLQKFNMPFFSNRDVAGCLDVSLNNASKIMERLAIAGYVVAVKRGRWVFPEKVDKLELPEILTIPLPSYVSLQSALYFHGLIDQVPSLTFAITLARTQTVKTPLGTISFHHVKPEMFFGFDMTGRVKLATPEKALVDFCYLSKAPSKLFTALPELHIGKEFDRKLAFEMLDAIDDQKLKTLARRRLQGLIGK